MKVFRRHALRTATVSALAFLYGTHAFATNYELPASLTGTITHEFLPEIFPGEPYCQRQSRGGWKFVYYRLGIVVQHVGDAVCWGRQRHRSQSPSRKIR